MATNQRARQTSTNYELYLLDESYKSDSNLTNVIDQAQDFYNGDQYPNANFNNMIRVTMNICRFSAQIKAAKVVGTPIYLTFTADNMTTDCNSLRQFDEYNCNKMQLDKHNYRAALNGFVNGTEVTFIRWDDDDTSYKGIYKGGLVEEHIDPRNFAVANPLNEDLQNQQWVMFWNDCSVGSIKAIVEGKSKKEIEEKKQAIESDALRGKDNNKNYDNIAHALVRVYTRFFRVDGEVYFMSSTERVDLFTFPHPLSRKVGNKIIRKVVDDYLKTIEDGNPIENGDKIADYHIDYEDLIMCAYDNKVFDDKDYKKIKEKFSLYPFAKFTPYAINGSFYGESGIKEIIPIQKGLNFALSMTLMRMQNNAYNKIIVKPDALQGQVVTNEPSQVLVDYSGFTNQWGIKFAESQPMPNGLLDAADRMLAMTRVVYNFSDVMDGSLTNQDMSGYMLQQMIKQSNTSIEQQMKLFWAYNEEKAYIRLMYYKHYVDKAKFTYEIDEGEIQAQDEARQMLSMKANSSYGKLDSLPQVDNNEVKALLDRPIHRKGIKEIKNEDMYGIGFDVSVDAVQGVLDSQLVEAQFYDNMMMNGALQNTDPEILEAYIKANPNVSQRSKAAIQSTIKVMKNSKFQQLKAQYAELLNKTQQIMAYAKQLENVTGYQGTYLKNLQMEAKTKIDNQNKIIGGLTKDLDKYRQIPEIKSEGEVKSNNSRGISGSTSQIQ